MLNELLGTLKKFKEIVIIYLVSLIVISFILHTEMLFARNSNLSGYCIIASVFLLVYKLNKHTRNKTEKAASETEIKPHSPRESFDFDLDNADCEKGKENG